MNCGRRAVFAMLALAGVAGCETTRITSEWRDPSFARVPFRKVLVAFQHADPGLRRIAEGEMARDIPNATAADTLFRDEELRDMARVKQRVRELGFDSSVIMRVVGVEHERTYVPGQVYAMPGYASGFWGSWGSGWTTVYEPGYLRQDRIVRIATNVYAVEADKLVWASESETFNPASLRGAIAEVVRVTAKAAASAMRERS